MYDVVIVGAGVGGATLATTLAQKGKRVALVERDLRPPQLFVGELLQPGGVTTLAKLGLAETIDGIDAQPSRGFAVVHRDEIQRLDYPNTEGPAIGALPVNAVLPARHGVSFHHGRFVAALRNAATAQKNADIIEGTVSSVIESQGRAQGVVYRDRRGRVHRIGAKVVIGADGRNSLLRKRASRTQAVRSSYSVGVLLNDAELPCPKYGHVFIHPPAPTLAYRISATEIRILVDIPGPLPPASNGILAAYLKARVAPGLGDELGRAFEHSVYSGPRLRAMPVYTLSPSPKPFPGFVLLGDALNMRHPITGGGMTVALNDADLLTEALGEQDLDVNAAVDARIQRYYRKRKTLAITIDMLAGALYTLLRAEDPRFNRMRDAMLDYWRCGGDAVEGPMSLVSGLAPSAPQLFYHYSAVAIHGIANHLLPGRSPGNSGPRPWHAPDFKGALGLAAGAVAAIRPQFRRIARR